MDISTVAIDALKQQARNTAKLAYVPYSRFPVGAAVLAEDGAIYTGANVENASYGLSICAERNAIFRAVAEGARRIVAIAVYTPTLAATPPCGACRQVLAEFGGDALIICCTDNDQNERQHRLSELLPNAFGANARADPSLLSG